MELLNSFSDVRGTIDWCEVGGVKFNVLFTKAGAMRSGDMHPVEQTDIVLSGKVQVTAMYDEDPVTFTVEGSGVIVIPANVPHLFKAIEDTVMVEMWKGEFEAQYYPPFRKQVDANIEQLKGARS